MNVPLIWFFKLGQFSHINTEVESLLRKRFPECEVRCIDVLEDILKKKRSLYLLASLHATLRYGKHILKERRPPRDFILRLPWVWKNVQKQAAALSADTRTWFTFQTQSLFDAGSKAVPHFVYTDHTYLANRRYPVPAPMFPASQEWKCLEASLYQQAAIVFVTSNFCVASLTQDYGLNKASVVCIFSGCNVRPSEEPPAREAHTILFVGLEWERKGGPELVEAFRQVKKEIPGARLLVAGCRPSLGIDGMEELGKLPLDEVRRLYMQATLFCLPSIREPSATVLMEAAAFGLPVISTDVGGTSDRVVHGETGWLVPPRDTDALTCALLEALRHPEEARRRGAQGKKRYFAHFRWDEVGVKMETMIRQQLHS